MPTILPRPLRIAVPLLPALLGLHAAAQEPYSALLAQTDTVYWYAVAPFSIPVKAGPNGAKLSCSAGARLVPADPAHGHYSLVVDMPEAGPTQIVVTARYGGRVDADTITLVGERPSLRSAKIDRNGRSYSGTDAWMGMRGVIGERYDPSSEWASPFIPADHYQTVVTIRGKEVLNRPGTTFHSLPPLTADALTLTEGTRPEDILTRVYWRPNGTSAPARWVLLLSNQEDPRAIIPLEHGMVIGYRSPDGDNDEREVAVTLSPNHLIGLTPELTLSDALAAEDHPVVESISCAECDRYGIAVGIDMIDALHGMLRVDATLLEPILPHRRELDGRVLPVDIIMRGTSGGSAKTIMIVLVIAKEER